MKGPEGCRDSTVFPGKLLSGNHQGILVLFHLISKPDNEGASSLGHSATAASCFLRWRSEVGAAGGLGTLRGLRVALPRNRTFTISFRNLHLDQEQEIVHITPSEVSVLAGTLTLKSVALGVRGRLGGKLYRAACRGLTGPGSGDAGSPRLCSRWEYEKCFPSKNVAPMLILQWDLILTLGLSGYCYRRVGWEEPDCLHQ